MAVEEKSDTQLEYTGGKLAANVAVAAVAAGAAATAATGLLIPGLAVGALGGLLAYLVTNEIPKIDGLKPPR